MDIALPGSLAADDGVVSGLSNNGGVLVSQMRGVVGADELSVYDPPTGSVEPVVSREPATSQASAVSQIAGGVANPDWVVWSEAGFTLEQGDWTIWAKDRHLGTVRKVKSFDPGSNGHAVPGWESSISLLGDIAVWSAPIEVAGSKVAPRIYVADLRAGTVSRLEIEGRWPSLIAADRFIAVVASGIDPASGKVLAVPATIALPLGAATNESWTEPARTLAFAASGAGQVATQLIKADGGENPAIARVATHDAAGATRSFDLPVDWGPVAAGDGFLAWQDQLHLWALPTGADAPIEVATIPDDTWGIAFLAQGPFLYWWTDNADVPGVHKLARVTCAG